MIERMTIEQWIAVPEHPIQGKGMQHAEYAKKRHLKEAKPPHKDVVAARLPNGDLFKVDGHTRAALWASGDLDPPAEMVDVTVYPVKTREQLDELYYCYDNTDASKNTTHRLATAYKRHGIVPRSWVLSRGGITSALRFLLGDARTFDIADAVGDWKEELLALDTIPFEKKRCCVSFVIAALLTIYDDGGEAVSFWRQYANDEGMKVGTKSDALYQLDRALLEAKSKQTLGGGTHFTVLAGKAIACYRGWQREAEYAIAPRAVDIYQYMKELGLRETDSKAKRATYAKKRSI